jgi:hypothetical protein
LVAVDRDRRAEGDDLMNTSEVVGGECVIAQAALAALEHLRRNRESGYCAALASLRTTIAAYESARAEYEAMLQAERERARENDALEVLARLEVILAVRTAVTPPQATPVTARPFEDLLAACTPWWRCAVGGAIGIAAFRKYSRSVALGIALLVVVLMLAIVTKSRVVVRRTIAGAVIGVTVCTFIAMRS